MRDEKPDLLDLARRDAFLAMVGSWLAVALVIGHMMLCAGGR